MSPYENNGNDMYYDWFEDINRLLLSKSKHNRNLNNHFSGLTENILDLWGAQQKTILKESCLFIVERLQSYGDEEVNGFKAFAATL